MQLDSLENLSLPVPKINTIEFYRSIMTMLTDEERSDRLQDLRGSPLESIRYGIPGQVILLVECRSSISIFA